MRRLLTAWRRLVHTPITTDPLIDHERQDQHMTAIDNTITDPTDVRDDQGADETFDVDRWVHGEERDRIIRDALTAFTDGLPHDRAERMQWAEEQILTLARERAQYDAEAKARREARRQATRCPCCGESGMDTGDHPTTRPIPGVGLVKVCAKCAAQLTALVIERDRGRRAKATAYLDGLENSTVDETQDATDETAAAYR